MMRLFLFAGTVGAITSALAHEPFDFATKDDGPTEVKILADSLECDQIKNVCTASGNASAQKLNDPELKTIMAHKLVAYFERNEKGAEVKKESPVKEAPKDQPKEEIKNKSKEETKDKPDDKSVEKDEGEGMGHMKLVRLEADGNVVMTTRENVIQGDRAEYKVQEEFVEVFGKNVKITNKENQLNGNYCQANLKTGKYKMVNEGARVQALITQAKKTKSNP